MTVGQFNMDEIEEIHQQLDSIADELDVDRAYAAELVRLHQNERIINELETIEVHTNNIVRGQ